MRMGKIVIDQGYAVDLDNPEMVTHAIDALYEDVMNSVKFDELQDWIKIIEDPSAKEEDIPGFLIENEDEDKSV
jgi:hypothetical protein